MFNSISWLQYALAISILLIGYYSVIISIYYRHRIASILKGEDQDKDYSQSFTPQKNVLGGIQQEQNSTSIVSDEIQFASGQSNELTEENQ